ncbi:polyprenyl synthetase [Nocardia sp. XZ_19_385]|uniref:polyprenyl synthetase n=1 Tax=Nocardia sp. XZ_19_385 TaxID=2769488 RepID=UPI001890A942|nr:polyprenyl synthetase [Nocardia sp. XZ_19_385]
MSQQPNQRGSRSEEAVLLAAGLADVALSRVGPVLERALGLLRRSDLPGLAGEAESDLKARGRLALDRSTLIPPAHMEILAQHVVAREAGSGAG